MNRRSEVRKNETDRNMVSSNRHRYLERKPRRNIAYSGLIRSSKSKANDSITRIVYTKDSRSKENQN
jgi:predicted GNAT family N-acyltransferase